MKGKARGIQSVEVAGRILRALVQSRDPMMLRDLADAADLAAAQCHAYLTSLKHTGLVHQDWDTGLYRMGPTAMRLGMAWLRSAPQPAASIKALRTLTEDLGFMSALSIWSDLGPTIVHINEGAWPLPVNLRQGTTFAVTGSATGRVFAAYSAHPNLDSLIARELSEVVVGADDPPARQEFLDQIEKLRRKGYSTAEEKPIPGINAIAAPILNADGSLAFAATLIAPSSQLSVKDASPAVTRLKLALETVSLATVESRNPVTHDA